MVKPSSRLWQKISFLLGCSCNQSCCGSSVRKKRKLPRPVRHPGRSSENVRKAFNFFALVHQILMDKEKWLNIKSLSGRLLTHLSLRRIYLIQKHVQVAEAQLLSEIRIQLPIVSPLVLSCLFCVSVTLMDQEIVGKDVKGDTGKVEFEEACSFVSSVTDEALVAPV